VRIYFHNNLIHNVDESVYRSFLKCGSYIHCKVVIAYDELKRMSKV